MYADIGTAGASNDAGIFERSSLKSALESGALNLPPIPAGDPLRVSYHLLADDAFGMSETVMKPYPNRSAEGKQRVFNYRFSRGRRVVENAFGIMTARCMVLRGPILQSYENAVKTVKACVVFHNLALAQSPPATIPGEREEDHMRAPLLSIAQSQGARAARGSHEARLQRDLLADYFMAGGQVSFQWEQAFGSSKK